MWDTGSGYGVGAKQHSLCIVSHAIRVPRGRQEPALATPSVFFILSYFDMFLTDVYYGSAGGYGSMEISVGIMLRLAIWSMVNGGRGWGTTF